MFSTDVVPYSVCIFFFTKIYTYKISKLIEEIKVYIYIING